MRIKDLKDAPLWLKNAGVVDEDVETVNGVVIWKDGIWKDGIWEGGVWKDGIWEGGVWKGGIWEGGIWKDGVWKVGMWKGGVWKDGAWKDGWKKIGQCKWPVHYSKTSIRIGCVEKTPQEWDEWFDSDEEIETKRGTEEFRKIQKAYKLAKYAMQLETEG